jgi:hypothetical protein
MKENVRKISLRGHGVLLQRAFVNADIDVEDMSWESEPHRYMCVGK